MGKMQGEIGRAILIHQGAIGDFLIALRLIEFCNRQFQRDYDWHYLGKGAHGKLAKRLGLISAFSDFEYPGWHLLFASNCEIDTKIRDFFRQFDLIVNVIANGESIFARNIEALAKSDVAKIFHIEPRIIGDISDKHYFQYLAEQMQISDVVDIPASTLGDIEVLPKDETYEKYVMIHPGASGKQKRWPIENFISIAKRLINNGEKVAFLLGNVELEQFPENDISELKSLATVIENCPLERLATIIASGKYYIGNDNGISHLSGALGIHTYTIFVRDNWRTFSPLGPNVHIIHGYKLTCCEIYEMITGNCEKL